MILAITPQPQPDTIRIPNPSQNKVSGRQARESEGEKRKLCVCLPKTFPCFSVPSHFIHIVCFFVTITTFPWWERGFFGTLQERVFFGGRRRKGKRKLEIQNKSVSCPRHCCCRSIHNSYFSSKSFKFTRKVYRRVSGFPSSAAIRYSLSLSSVYA